MTNEDKILNVLEKHGEMLEKLVQGQAKLEQGQAKLEQGQAKLEQEVAGIRQDVTILKTDVSEIRQDVKNLKTDVSEIRQDVTRIKITIETEISPNLVALKERDSLHSSQLDRISQQIEGIEDMKMNMSLYDMAIKNLNEERQNRENLKKV